MRLQSVIISVFIWAATLCASAAEAPATAPDTPDQALRLAEALRLQSAAETAFLTTNRARGFEILNEIEKSFPEYYEMNRIRFLLLEALALEEMGRYPDAAQKLAMIHDRMQKGAQAGLIERESIRTRLENYQKSGWLDAEYRALPEQLRKPAPPSKKKNFLGYTIGSLLILPIFFAAVFYSRKKRLKRLKAIMKQ
ncbi:MAG TPA: hypothetical protein PLV91_06355 [Verrucomicrobiota bacterium]|nr:hypothetical protein [Verrucomicrobiota bacterium]